MENSLLVGLSHQGALRRRMDIIANNLANMNSTAFKAQRVLFQDHLVRSDNPDSLLGYDQAFVRDASTVRDFREGGLTATENPFDLSIRGDGWFVVETPAGIRYTRNGSIRIDPTGQLVTEHGHPVLAEGDTPIVLEDGSQSISVATNGTISSDIGEIARLRIVRFPGAHDLKAVTGGLMATEARAEDVAAPHVEQGVLERSNVEPILEITRLINVQRAYQRAAKLIQSEDQRVRSMVEEYAR